MTTSVLETSPPVDTSDRAFEQALRHFERLREDLEERGWGQFAAISPTGQYATGATSKAAIADFEAMHGVQQITTFRIGR
jgi:hypothetical protein